MARVTVEAMVNMMILVLWIHLIYLPRKAGFVFKIDALHGLAA